MKKRKTGAFLSGCAALGLCLALTGSSTMTVRAETFYGNSDWKVSFNAEGKLDSNFKTAELNDAVAGLQPGDTIIFTMALANDNDKGTDWYMTNQVLSSLEDSAEGNNGGGAYTYELTYSDKNGVDNILFSSDTIGGEGEAATGLHSANDSLKDFFYLDTLGQGEKGTVTLRIALDGETQGNDYQDTLADLQMRFAVDPSAGGGASGSGNSGSQTGVVKTGDETNLFPLFLAIGISGMLLLLLACYELRQNQKRKKEVQAE